MRRLRTRSPAKPVPGGVGAACATKTAEPLPTERARRRPVNAASSPRKDPQLLNALVFGGTLNRRANPTVLTDRVLQLQKTHGNRAVQRMLQRTAQPAAKPETSAPPTQPLANPEKALPETPGNSSIAPAPTQSLAAPLAAPSPKSVAPATSASNGRSAAGSASSPANAVAAQPPGSAATASELDSTKGTAQPSASRSLRVDSGSPETLLQSIASAPASSFPEALQSAKAAFPGMAARQQSELENSYPEIERPARMARGPRPAKVVPRMSLVGNAAAVQVPASGAGTVAPPEKTTVATGPVPGVNLPVSAPEPANGQDGGSWWDWLTGHLRSLLSSLPTTDPAVSTSAGPRPHTDLSGAADPAQNEAIANSGREQVESQRAQADQATAAKFGDEQIAFTVQPGKLRGRLLKPATPGVAPGGKRNVPDVPEDMRAQLDRARGPSVRAEVNRGLAQQRRHQAEFETASDKARQDGQRRIAVENERARTEQMGVKAQARADVNAERERWRAENRKLAQNYSDGTQAKRAETEKQINEKVKATDQAVDSKISDAETGADQERAKAEQQAAQKKAEVENKPRSFWDGLKGAVSSFFNEIKSAITQLFEEMRQAVQRIIDEAKALVHEWIQAARQFVVGLIRTFGEYVKAAVSIALAAFPDLAKKACDWIDHRVDDAVNAVNRVADALEKRIDAILDFVGATLDAALRALQSAFLAILDGLEALANAVLTAMEWLAKLAEFLKKFGAFLKGLGELLKTGAEKLINNARKTLQQYIDRIPGKVEAFVQEVSTKLGKAAAKHVQGVWRHLKPALAYLKDNWWTEVKQMVWNLVWPFNEKSPIWKDVPAMIMLPGKILQSLGKGQISQAADQYLELIQKVNDVAGVFYGWFFIASVLVGTIIGAFFGGAGAIPGAIAGASLAAEAGEALLIAMVATETAVTAKAAYDLAFGPGTDAVNEGAYDRIANSGLTLAITGAMMLLGELAADLAKAIIKDVKGIFRGEAPEAPKLELPKKEAKASEPAKVPPEADIAAKEPTARGHQIEVTKGGEVLFCSDCSLLRREYAKELGDPANAALKAELDAADRIPDPAAKAKAAADVEAKLAKIREMKIQAMQKAAIDAAGAIKNLKEKFRSREVGELRADPATKNKLAKLEAEVDALERERVDLHEQAADTADAFKDDPELKGLAANDADVIRTKLDYRKARADKINQEIEDQLQQLRQAKAREEARRLAAEQEADEAGRTANNICDETDGKARPDATIGDGTTEAVLREEIRTGEPIKSPEGHWIKTEESMAGLQRAIQELNNARLAIKDPAKLKAIDQTLTRANIRLAKLRSAWDEWQQRATTHPDVWRPDGSSKIKPGWP